MDLQHNKWIDFEGVKEQSPSPTLQRVEYKVFERTFSISHGNTITAVRLYIQVG